MRLFLCPSELLLDGGELWAAEEIQSGGTPIIMQDYGKWKFGEMV